MAKQVEDASPVLKMDINYHYAHAIKYGNKVSEVEILDAGKGVVKIKDTPVGPEGNALVKFSLNGIKTLLNKEKIKFMGEEITAKDNLTLEVDTYSGVVAIKYTILQSVPKPNHYLQYMNVNNDPYIYNEKIGYSERVKDYLHAGGSGIQPQLAWVYNYKPADDFGYIMESPLRMTLILCKELAFVDNLQKGILKFRTSSFDLNGYVVQLFPEAILEITQLADKGRMPLLESSVGLREMREVREEREHKEEAPKLAKSEEVDLSSLSLIPAMDVEEAPVVLSGHSEE